MAAPKTGTDEFIKGLWKENPVFVQVLGMCPVLAVSNTALNALAMGLATLFVLVIVGGKLSSVSGFQGPPQIEAWRHDYNHHLPHTSLDGLTPWEYRQQSVEDQTLNRANS